MKAKKELPGVEAPAEDLEAVQGLWVRKGLVDDTFVEIWGVLGDKDEELSVHRWKRTKTAQPAEQPEKT